MKKKYKNTIAIIIAAIIIYGLYYVVITVPTRHDRTLIKDLSKTNKILITLSRYDYICFSIKARDQKMEFKNLQLIIKEPSGKTFFSTRNYIVRGNSISFEPRFYSAAKAFPQLHVSNPMTLFLKPEVPFELEIKYQSKDNKKVFQGASLEMMASSKGKYGYSDKHFSVTPVHDK